MQVKISADSTCDLSADLIEKNDLYITPLYIIDGENSYKDGIEISAADIFSRVSSTGKLMGTAAVTVADYIEAFREMLKDHSGIVHFTISSDMSACYQNACLAATEFENVYIIDSRSLSTGIGHLVLDAAEMAAAGASAKEIYTAINQKKDKLDVSFIVDTLVYLHKGGRCSTVATLGANLLSLKPCIEVQFGKMDVAKKYRGNLKKCLCQYVRDRLEGRDDLDLRRIFVTDSGISDELYTAVKDTILTYQPFAEVLHTRAGCTVSNHCGPNTLGILFYHK